MVATTKKPILIIEDDRDISELIRIHLSDLSYDVEQSYDGNEALELALSNRYSMLILDIMLPGTDGFDICKEVRKHDMQLPILMLTAKAEEIDKIMGLEFGADDYLTKPFSIRELTARVKALLRRSDISGKKHRADEKSVITFENLKIFPHKRSITIEEEMIELTAKEFDLLYLFASNPGRAYSRDNLLDLVWGYQYEGYSHTVNSHINRLRTKIEKDPSEPKYIKTVWGLGYRFTERRELS
ncbi:response regulator transcription factor [Rhodohalobacter mucosus]|uniref:Phosphate regulon transcriptional regulatory protein PhoB n=1 Tax=Rhodohalobacter mucosus TaxID=2079485 RepID=A0A316TN49_9BACT|nr:response regulator transcription factor [Rhodohalobacter mucosus]PWN06027.1 DNA-binding response regulator [Rhodohalobacter mucosus]